MIQSFSAATAQLVHLSGPERGRTRRVFGTTHLVPLAGGRLKLVYGQPQVSEQPLAVLVADRNIWVLEVAADSEAWVNGTRAGSRTLHAGDLIEIGDRGLLLRFRIRVAGAAYKSVREAFEDCLGCARLGGHGTLERIGIMMGGAVREFATQVRPIVRAAFAVGAGALVAGLGSLWIPSQLSDDLDLRLQGVEGLGELLAASERAAFTLNDFDKVRSQLDFRINDTLAKIEALENRATARGRVISEVSSAVVFVQGAYRFVEPHSGRVLRSTGTISGGVPTAVTVDGDGSPLELRYTGAGFVLAELNAIATNRHIALPWEFNATALRLIDQGFTPTIQRIVGYLPGIDEPFDLEVQASHAQANLAILRSTALEDRVAGLRLAESIPEIGDEILILGYPSGVRSLLARANPTYVSRLLADGPLGFWDIACHLAHGGYLVPLATVGNIGQITAGAIVYDANTTLVGSGGPILTLDGAVVALNAVVLPEFGGSSTSGVPIQQVRELMTP